MYYKHFVVLVKKKVVSVKKNHFKITYLCNVTYLTVKSLQSNS